MSTPAAHDLQLWDAPMGTPRAYAAEGAGWWAQPKPRPGPGYLSGEPPHGLTTVKGVPGPVEVRVIYRPSVGAPGDGVLVATATSGQDGTWRVEGIDPALEFDVVFRRSDYNDMILSRVKPKAYPPLELVGSLSISAEGGRVLGELQPNLPTTFSYQIVDGFLAPGLSLTRTANGLRVRGWAQQPGSYSCTLRITDAYGRTALHALTLGPFSVPADPHWGSVVSLLSFNSEESPWQDGKGNSWQGARGTGTLVEDGPFDSPAMHFKGDTWLSLPGVPLSAAQPLTIESFFKKPLVDKGLGSQLILGLFETSTNRISYYWTDRAEQGDAFRVYQRPGLPDTSENRVVLESGFDPGAWRHVAYVRDVNGHRLYIDGVLASQSNQPLNGLTATLYLGALTAITENFYGQLSNLRVTKGVARYTSDFSPPSRPFPAF